MVYMHQHSCHIQQNCDSRVYLQTIRNKKGLQANKKFSGINTGKRKTSFGGYMHTQKKKKPLCSCSKIRILIQFEQISLPNLFPIEQSPVLFRIPTVYTKRDKIWKLFPPPINSKSNKLETLDPILILILVVYSRNRANRTCTRRRV